MHRLVVLLAVTACATTGADNAEVASSEAGAVATINFDSGWNEVAGGALIAGQQVRISFDPARLRQCRASTHGSEAWGITGFAKFDDGDVLSFPVTDLGADRIVHPITAQIPMQGTRKMELWFQNSDVFGCVAYDSNFNANYRFDLQSAPTAESPVIAFETDWSETQSGAIHAGDALIVHYDPLRLNRCSGSTHGNAAWAITGWYAIDGGEAHSFAASKPDGGTLLAADPAITVGDGRDLAVWFEATSIWGCHDWDSDFGANYHFAIE